MKQFFQRIRTYTLSHKRKVLSWFLAVLIIAGFITAIIVGTIESQPKIIYQPVDACSLLSLDQAKSLLGDKAVNGNHVKPVIKDHNAASSCTYADTNTDVNADTVIAISVRSAIDDGGIQQNIGDFVTNKPKTGVKDVKDANNLEYLNTATGVFNILSDGGKQWIRLSYGVGSSPQTNTLDDAIKLATVVLK